MTTTSNPKSNPLNNRKLYSTLTDMSEAELIRLRHSVKVMRRELQLIPSPNGEPVKAVKATQQLLKMWSIQLSRILAAKQTHDTNADINTWDNEGGAADEVQKHHSFGELSGRNPTTAIEDADTTKLL